MQRDPWERWSPLAGVAYVLLFLGWTALAFGAGVASATLLMASTSVFLARARAASQDEFAFDPATANMFTNAAPPAPARFLLASISSPAATAAG
jgi:hypothetical protein